MKNNIFNVSTKNHIHYKSFRFEDQNDLFGFKASKRRVHIIQENNRISNLEAQIKYAANRVFINNGDSYHGKYIIQEISQVLFTDIEYINLDTELTEKNTANDKYKDQELNSTYQDSQKSQNSILNNTYQDLRKSRNSILNKSINSMKSVSVDKDLQVNNVLDKVYIDEEVDNETPEKQFKYIRNIEVQPMYNIHKPTIKVNKEDVEEYKYDIVTTVKNKLNIDDERYKYLKNVKKIIISNNKQLLMKEIQKCAVVVYDISLAKNQITEASIALHSIIEEIKYIKCHPKSVVARQSGIRVFILISSIQTWALTKNKYTSPITQDDYKDRICHPNFQSFYDMENCILLLNDKYSGYFYGIILAPGLVYGQGEHILKYIYKMVFSDAEQLLVPKEDNNLPIIHVENLAKIVKNLVVYYDKVTKPYIVGIETAKISLRSITKCIIKQTQKKNYVYCDYISLCLNSRITQTVYDMITMSIQIVPVIDNYITQFMGLDKSIPRIFTETKTLISEYHNKYSKKKNIIINGPLEIINFAEKLAHTYNLYFVDLITISKEFFNILENSVYDIDSNWLQNLNILLNKSSNKFEEKHLDNLPTFGNKQLLEEQKKHFKDYGRISDKYLLPFIKNKILKNKVNKCGYIIANFLENIEQAQNLFDLKHFESKKENDLQLNENEIYPTIIIDVIMVGKNVMRKIVYNSETEQINLNSKLVCDDVLDKLLDWPSLDSKYTESEIMKHILENDHIEIRKNRNLVDYLEVLFKPKIYKEYLLITQSNCLFVDQREFDKLFDSLLINMPAKLKVNEAENKVCDIKDMINKTYVIHPTMIKNKDLAMEEDIYEKNLAQLLKDSTIKKEEHFSLQNTKIIDFLIKCVNPLLINGILEIMKNTPEDPIDFLVEYIYNHNMYNPCVSSPPLNKKPKVAKSLNKHLL
ncbi:adenylate kinase 7-like isoform X2 [Aphis gossypii]|uniref:adenylate kinase 7-like isoform X2 n=1 Tax=Aphis gossypii TaxID=80765 RepID=UPI002158FEFF|nr:adenylate kinase 7-like isoform X2 [Aphis gossypii]